MKKILSLVVIALSLIFFACSGTKKTATGAAAIANTSWKLLYAGNTPYNPPPGVRLVTMRLNDSTKTISGFMGCNNLAGNYVLSGKDGITFTVISTKMMCKPDAMTIEKALSDALMDANKYKVENSRLALFKDDTFLAAFVAEK